MSEDRLRKESPVRKAKYILSYLHLETILRAQHRGRYNYNIYTQYN